MTDAMASGLSLHAPSSRQDIVSALLDGYGSGFAPDEDSPYALSPVPALKELPLPPPGSNDKALPPVMMRFQLRVDEPGSNHGPRQNSIDSPTKIVSRAIARNSRPPSLKLLASNGSTAIVPASGAPPTPAKDDSTLPRSSKSSNDRPLPPPPPPPPPPAKSERRLSQRQAQSAMGTSTSKVERRDSKEPQESDNAVTRENSDPRANSSQATKRKPLPGAGVAKKFASLADLQKGPRGRSVAPKTTTSSTEPVPATAPPVQDSPQRTPIPTKNQNSPLPSTPRSRLEEAPSRNALLGQRPTFSKSPLSELPPTPDERPPEPPAPARAEAPAPAPPKKVFAGLPSNPRARGPQTPSDVRPVQEKSSTRLDTMKDSKQVPPITTTNLNTITPGPTPSPRKSEAAQNGAPAAAPPPSLANSVQAALKRPQSPISPVTSEEDSGRRPFSFEALPPQPRKQSPPQSQPERPQPAKPASPVSPSPTITQFPPRTTSKPSAQSPTQEHPDRPQPSIQPRFPLAAKSPDYAFVPLVLEPIPAPNAPITDAHLSCYTRHATFARHFTKYQPTPCMVCLQNNDPRKVSCHWCYLRICLACQDKLVRIPGRSLQTLLDNKGIERKQDTRKDSGMPSVIVWEAEDELEGEGREALDWT